jgi:hypothetical protein
MAVIKQICFRLAIYLVLLNQGIQHKNLPLSILRRFYPLSQRALFLSGMVYCVSLKEQRFWNSFPVLREFCKVCKKMLQRRERFSIFRVPFL